MKVLGMRQEHSTVHAHHTALSGSQAAARGDELFKEKLLQCQSEFLSITIRAGSDTDTDADPQHLSLVLTGIVLAGSYLQDPTSSLSQLPLSLPSASCSPGHRQAPKPLPPPPPVFSSGFLPSWNSHRHTHLPAVSPPAVLPPASCFISSTNVATRSKTAQRFQRAALP